MKYISTRGTAPSLDFRGVTLAGLAADGGLYVPEVWPEFPMEKLKALRTAPYTETAFEVIRLFTGEAISDTALQDLLKKTYSSFGHAAVTPLRQLDGRHWLLELFHGPTLAFKDVALQLLGGFFSLFHHGSEELTIVGATSGDTGSAAIAAVANRPGIRIFMLHPKGRITDVQRRQMTTIAAPNVHNISINGSFDDAQAIVKQLFNDAAFRAEQHLSAVNSINWARIVAQIVYYVHTIARLDGPVSFSVPTGNFGDVFAGYIAKRMGLPIDRLVVATNINDILVRALRQGHYAVSKVIPTETPSMDIQISSNFERLLFDLLGQDSSKLAAAMASFEKSGELPISEGLREKAAQYFMAERVTPEEVRQTMGWTYENTGEVIDPHSAIGLTAARRRAADLAGPVVTLATAHPAKFPDTVEEATGVRPGLPRRIANLFELEEHYVSLPTDLDALKAHIRATH